MRNVWAIAKTTIAQAFRMKVAVLIVLLLGIVLPLMSVICVGDGTLIGKLQTFSSYGISLISVMLCMLAISVSCFTLHSDIKNNQIYTVVTKPVRRFQIVLGKVCGVLIMDVVLLVIFAAIIYAFTMLMPRFSRASSDEIAQANSEFFIARIGLVPEIDEAKINEQTLNEYNRLKNLDALPDNQTKSQILALIRAQKLMQAKTVEPGATMKWSFENVRPASQDETIYIKFKYDVSVDPLDLSVYSRWVAGDLRPFEKGEKPTTPLYDSYNRKDAVRTVREIQVPASVVTADGHLDVGFQSLVYNQTTVIPQEIEVLYRIDSFTNNFIRAVLLVFIRLFFLTVLGVSLSTWLSFPVAFFACIVVYLTGTVNGFIMESFESLNIQASVIYSLTIKPLLSLLPKFDGIFNPAPMIVSAKYIGWLFLLEFAFWTALVKSAIMLGLGILIFNSREIAKVTV